MQSTPFDTPKQKRATRKVTCPIAAKFKRPVEANERSRLGDWEADIIVGFNHKSGVLTLVDRRSRFLIAAKLARLGSKDVESAIIAALRGQSAHTITPDRGREFQLHGN